MARTHTPRVASEDGNPPLGALLLRKRFFTSQGKVLQGNFYLELARFLFRVHRPIIPKRDKHVLRQLEIAICRHKMELKSTKRDPWFGLRTFHAAIQYKRFARETYNIIKGASDSRDADDETIIFERERAENATYAGLDSEFSLEGATQSTEDEILRASSSTGSITLTELFGPPSSDSLDSGPGDRPHATLFGIV